MTLPSSRFDEVATLAAISNYHDEHRYAPNIDDLAKALGLGRSTTYYRLTQLRARRLVSWVEFQARTLHLTPIGNEYLSAMIAEKEGA